MRIPERGEQVYVRLDQRYYAGIVVNTQPSTLRGHAHVWLSTSDRFNTANAVELDQDVWRAESMAVRRHQRLTELRAERDALLVPWVSPAEATATALRSVHDAAPSYVTATTEDAFAQVRWEGQSYGMRLQASLVEKWGPAEGSVSKIRMWFQIDVACTNVDMLATFAAAVPVFTAAVMGAQAWLNAANIRYSTADGSFVERLAEINSEIAYLQSEVDNA